MSPPGRPKGEYRSAQHEGSPVSAAANRKAAADPDHVASPCTSVCTMDAVSGLCIGCLRTLDEIAAWSVLDAPTKRAIVEALPARRARRADPPR